MSNMFEEYRKGNVSEQQLHWRANQSKHCPPEEQLRQLWLYQTFFSRELALKPRTLKVKIPKKTRAIVNQYDITEIKEYYAKAWSRSFPRMSSRAQTVVIACYQRANLDTTCLVL